VAEGNCSICMHPPLARPSTQAYLILYQNLPPSTQHAKAPPYYCTIISFRQVCNPLGPAIHFSRCATGMFCAGCLEADHRRGIYDLIHTVIQDRVLSCRAAAVVAPPLTILLLAGEVSRRRVVVLAELVGPSLAHCIEYKIPCVEVTI
jgi:hypothetical protein